jgi:hypothetical protein
MSFFNSCIGILALFLLTGCVNRTDPTPVTNLDVQDKQEIKDMLSRYYADMSRRDWKKFRGYFWDSATITTVWQKPGDLAAKVNIITIDEFIRETPFGPDSKPIFQEIMTGADISVRNDLAIAWADYEAKFGTNDSLAVWKGKDLFSIMRHLGEWKIVALSFERE